MVSPADIAAGALLLGVIMYAIFGGADFGGGAWTALTSGRRAEEQREALFNAIGPVWETNHTWLIFVVVTLFTCFPAGFAALFTALLIPLVIALVGINFRGAAFAFRHFGREHKQGLPATGQVFSVSSILTPLALGMAVSSIASGRIRLVNGQVVAGLWSSWINLFCIGGGLVGLAICAYVSAVLMIVRTEGEMREDFRVRAAIASFALGVLTTLQVIVAYFDVRPFFDALMRPLPLLVAAAAILCGLGTLFLLVARIYAPAQVLAGITVGAILVGFGAALYPYLLIGQMTFAQAAAPQASIVAYLTILPIGALILVPSLVLLYRTFTRQEQAEV